MKEKRKRNKIQRHRKKVTSIKLLDQNREVVLLSEFLLARTKTDSRELKDGGSHYKSTRRKSSFA